MPSMIETRASELASIRHIHTLGPKGTNCEAAAAEWFRRNNIHDGAVTLHSTLESALEKMDTSSAEALLSCIVYPDLHTLVFSNLNRIKLVDTFIMRTHNMVLAAREKAHPSTVASHPAPIELVPSGAQIVLANSNSHAALLCVSGETDGCVTTLPAAKELGLTVLADHGAVPMGFALHVGV